MKENNKVKNIIKLVFILILGYIVGFIIGTFDNMFDYSINISPIVLQLLPSLPLLIVLIIFNNTKRAIHKDNYSNEEVSVYAKNENKLFITLSISTVIVIINIMVFGIIFSQNLISLLEESIIKVIVILIIFTINIVLSAGLEIAHVNLIKKVEPEKNTDPLDINYNIKALNTFDEHELEVIGKASSRTMCYMPFVFTGVFLLGLFTEIGRAHV